jgi:cytidine deaminase
MDRQILLRHARAAAQHAHSPYSHFRVGAALLADDQLFTGANIEISSYGLTLCAERAALAAAISQGARSITHIAVACIDAAADLPLTARMPCGACRQWLADLASEAVIFVDGIDRAFSIHDLMPLAFTLPLLLDGQASFAEGQGVATEDEAAGK